MLKHHAAAGVCLSASVLQATAPREGTRLAPWSRGAPYLGTGLGAWRGADALPARSLTRPTERPYNRASAGPTRLGRPARFGEVFRALVIGDLGNNVLPMRAGEAARVVLVNRQMGFSAARAATSIVLERLSDVVVLAAILFVLLPFVRIPRVAV